MAGLAGGPRRARWVVNGMRHVDLNATQGAFTGVLDPEPYLAQLAEFAAALPAGARAFATDPDHYDFFSQRCVKDLRLRQVSFAGDRTIHVAFRHNCWKHDEDLTLSYRGVESFLVEPADLAGFGDVVLDEILPHPYGCSHEIAFRPGTITVVCLDLTATWTAADCTANPTAHPS
jgi:hypothetical protein